MSYTKKEKKKEVKYLTDYEYNEALRLYYNGLDWTKAIIPEKEKQSWFNQSIADSFMLEGEVYKQLDIFPEHRTDHYIYTSFGRYINTRTGIQSPVSITQNHIVLHTGQTSVTLERLFGIAGWEYDYNQLVNNYKQYKWRVREKYSYMRWWDTRSDVPKT